MKTNTDKFSIAFGWQLVMAIILLLCHTLLIFSSWNYGINYLCSLFGYKLPYIGFWACLMIWASLCTFNIGKILSTEKVEPFDGMNYLNIWLYKTLNYILIAWFIYFIYICIV